jgi:dihydrofolate synthase/folylpolyglutamate synthase
MNYQEALAWLYSFSDSERTGVFVHDREDNLRRERALVEALGNPQRAYGITHVAGTKGKGSTSAMIASILRAAGVRVGLYSQPDLHTFRERMRVNGEVIPAEDVARLTPRVREALATIGDALGSYITYEVATSLMFLAFRELKVEHAVVEVGLGGRLDATNIVEPMVTVITSISFDHMALLGTTLGSIAREKAGIVKQGIPLICSAQAPEALAVIEEIARERAAPSVRVGAAGCAGCEYAYMPRAADTHGQVFDLATPTEKLTNLRLSLLGEHQLENAAAAVAAARSLRDRGLPITDDVIREGLRVAAWPARMQVVGERPWVVVDGAHNADSFAKLFAGLRRHFDYDELILVLGVMSDKDISGIAREISLAGPALIVTSPYASPRAATPESLAAAIHEQDRTLAVATQSSSAAAIADALAAAGSNDLVCVSGSIYLAGEALRWFAGRETPTPIEIAGVDH